MCSALSVNLIQLTLEISRFFRIDRESTTNGGRFRRPVPPIDDNLVLRFTAFVRIGPIVKSHSVRLRKWPIPRGRPRV